MKNISHSILLKSCEDVAPLKENHEKEDDEEDAEEEKKRERGQDDREEKEEQQQQQQDDCEEEMEEWDEEMQQREDEYHDYPECTSLGFRESDEEKSLDLTESPRPLSQETRNLTASELLLNKSVDARNVSLENKSIFFCLSLTVFPSLPSILPAVCLKTMKSQSPISFS